MKELEDKIDKTNSTWENRVKNNNIPVDNLNKFGPRSFVP